MDHNEISMIMDAKLDLQDKRTEAVIFREWIRCQVTIEAIKCLPCFLRITLDPSIACQDAGTKKKNFTVSINVPGVVITLASSRTKQHSYAVSWMQNRKNCYIYFAMDTELMCRRHMKWIRKSIKNLELHRKLMLEERRTSRGVASTLGPLPLLPGKFEENDSTWSQRVSEIYEEIVDGSTSENDSARKESQRLSRHCSRASIASGIYEEMKAPFNVSNNFEAINEEMFFIPSTPPPLPPLPPQRKRFNTFEVEENVISSVSEEIPRSNTNPETELAKKKKYKYVLENLFHGSGLRSKRTVSASSDGSKEPTPDQTETPSKLKQFFKAESVSRIIYTATTDSPKSSSVTPIYANNESIATKRQKKTSNIDDVLKRHCSKRNSFSSPDLSKINFIDTFDEQRIAELLSNSYSKCEELDFENDAYLDETGLMVTKTTPSKFNTKRLPTSNNSEEYNISQHIPNNFNFSACNSSAINLIAPLSNLPNKQLPKNKIIFDDLSGYCVMAPIVKKMSAIDNTPLPIKLESTSSGYSTGSHCSSASSCTNSAEESNPIKTQSETRVKVIQEESVVYENMQGNIDTVDSNTVSQFTDNLYENLLAIKAAQELEHIPITNSSKISTSTPTESPMLEQVTPTTTVTKIVITEEENYYETPRKSIISFDEKVPSYYPNTCESSVKSRRCSYSPARVSDKQLSETKTPTSSNAEKPSSSMTTTPVLPHLMSSKLKNERKENIYLTSPQNLIDKRRKSKENTPTNICTKNTKTKKTAAHKISENVYAVRHCLKKSSVPQSNCNNNIENKIQNSSQDKEAKELLHIAMLQNIDFKFEDPKGRECDDLLTENTWRTPQSTASQSPQQHKNVNVNNHGNNVGIHSTPPNTTGHMSHSTITSQENFKTVDNQFTTGIKKFASLPRFKKFNLSPLRTRINNVLQRNHTPDL